MAGASVLLPDNDREVPWLRPSFPRHGAELPGASAFQSVLNSENVVTSKNVFNRGIDPVPLLQQLGKHRLPIGIQAIEPLVALVLFAPLALQQPLCLQPPQQRVERALVNRQP